jgi:flagellar P-ring protein FlgI
MRCSLGLTVIAFVAMSAVSAHADRLKDVADVRGVRPNKLLGYGLVVGLAGTGDDSQARFGADSVVTLLSRLGVHVDAERLTLRNIAAVIVTAELPAFAAAGQSIDVTVSSAGNATSLEGGTLLATPLKGADLNVYAVAQGQVSIGGFLASGKSGSRAQKNHTTVGLIPGGAMVEREISMSLERDELAISLHVPDFTTATRVAQAINTKLQSFQSANDLATAAPTTAPPPIATSAPTATPATDAAQATGGTTTPTPSDPAGANGWHAASARDAGTVLVPVPSGFRRRVPELIATIEVLEVTPDTPTRVVINERTGTIVLGEAVRIDAVAIAHGGLTLEVKETPQISQPAPFSLGKTTVVPNTQIQATEAPGQLKEVKAGASLRDVIKALNALDVAPRDLVAILQALKAAGALHAELEVQ